MGLLGAGGFYLASGLAFREMSEGISQDSLPRRALPPLPALANGETLRPGPVSLHLTPEGGQMGFGYNGTVPGPLFRVRRGETFEQVIENGLDDETTVHWHGLVPPPEMDGHPADPIHPGATKSVRFPVNQRAGLNWYHPHPHGHTASQVWNGLAGLFIVADEEEDALGLPGGDRELLLVLRDAEINEAGDLIYRDDITGNEGNFPLVNGVPWARTELGNVQNRLRILNGSNARVFTLTTTAPMTLIGNDGGLLDTPKLVDAIEMSPGERVDVILDLRGHRPGATVALTCSASDWRLLDIGVVEGGEDTFEMPARLSTIETLVHDGPIDREFRFEGDTTINGRLYDMNLTAFVVPFGKTERWRLNSAQGAPHPIHVHGGHFQIQSRTGGRNRLYPWEKGWKDTVLMWGGGEVIDILVRFDAYEGRYLMHCHKLEHEDHGMMMNFVVSKNPEEAERIAELERLYGPICTPPLSPLST